MSLHKEALAEAKQLKEVAIKNAKNAIVESITPQVKELIERELLEAKDDKDDDEDNVLQDAAGEIERDVLDATGEINPMAGEDPGLSLPDDEGKVTLDLDALQSDENAAVAVTDGGEEIELTAESLQALANLAGAESETLGLKVLNLTEKLSGIRKDKALLSESVAYSEKVKQLKIEVEAVFASLQENKKVPFDTRTLLESRLETLYSVINHMYLPAKLAVVEESFVRLGKRVIGVGRVFQKVPKNTLTKETRLSVVKTSRGMLREALVLNDGIIELGKISQTDKVKMVSNNISRLYKEICKMARHVLSEQDFTLMIKGLPDEVDVETLDVEAIPPEGEAIEGEEIEGGEEFDLDVGDIEGEEGGEELDLDLDVGGDDEEVVDEMDAQIDVDLPLGDEEELDISGIEADISPVDMDDDMGGDMGDEEMDLDLDVGGEEDIDLDVGGEEEEDMDMDIEEIVAEIEGMNEDEGDVQLEISESMLRRELSRMKSRRMNEEVSDQMIDPKASQFGGGVATKEPFRDTTDADITTENLKRKLQKEARMNRALLKKLESYKEHVSKLRKELAAHALFNEKIVHANQLLQNENLSPKVRLKIIGALDGAESLKEVRKTYRVLVKALEKSKNKKSLSEGANKRGSSSSLTRSGAANEKKLKEQTLKEGAEVARWGELAGLND